MVYLDLDWHFGFIFLCFVFCNIFILIQYFDQSLYNLNISSFNVMVRVLFIYRGSSVSRLMIAVSNRQLRGVSHDLPTLTFKIYWGRPPMIYRLMSQLFTKTSPVHHNFRYLNICILFRTVMRFNFSMNSYIVVVFFNVNF